MPIGSQISVRLSMTSKPGGMMPMMSCGRPSICTVVPDDGLSAKRRLPQFVREDRDRRAAEARARRHGIGLAWCEEPPLFWLHAEGREEMVVHQRGAHAHRAIAGREIDRTGPAARAARRHAVANGECADVRKRSGHLAELEILGGREPEPLERVGRKMRGEAHQLLGARIPEGPHDHVPEDREDRGVGADAERQRQQRDGSEDGTAPKRADRVAQISSDLSPARRRDEPDRTRSFACSTPPR